MSALLAALAGDAAAAQNGTPPTLLRASELRRSPDADVDGAPSVALARPELRGPTGGGPGGRSPTTRGPAPPPAQRGSAAAGRAEAAVWAAEVARRRASADAKVEAVGRAVAGVAAAEAGWAALCRQVTVGCCGGGIVFVTPEMGRWGSVGGLGGMVANLSRALAARGLDVTVIAPAYRSLASEWADASELASCRKVTVALGRERCAVEVLTDRHDKVRLLLLRSEHFAAPYKGRGGGDAWHALVPAVLLARGALELMRELRMTPAAVITNDWVAALTAPYARARGGEAVGGGAEYWERTAFVHLFHNLEPGYDGTIALPAQKGEKYDPSPAEPLAALHQLPSALLHDEGQAGRALSLSRAALLASNAWATVSPGYRSQLLASSAAFAPLLRTFRAPFACAGGLPLAELREALVTYGGHEVAKRELQRRCFGEAGVLDVPLLCFLGRVCHQKGVHLLLDCVPALLEHAGGRVQLLVCGQADGGDAYGQRCAAQMRALRHAHPRHFWAAPWRYFTDGALACAGADFGLMPSAYEPCGLVREEFFAAGTPLVCSDTGGLRDRVANYVEASGRGAGIVFGAHTHRSLLDALQRALRLYADRDHYAALRANAHDAACDVGETAWRWEVELHRLCACLQLRQSDLLCGEEAISPTISPDFGRRLSM